MRSLAKDIVERGEIYEAPLVYPAGKDFVVFDGNRRVTASRFWTILVVRPLKSCRPFLQNYVPSGTASFLRISPVR